MILGQDFYLNAGTGGYQKLPLSTASSIFDPSAILDPNRGIVKLMTAATATKTEANEQVNGKDAYRVAVTPDPASVSGLIPGAGAGTTGKIWIDATTHEVVKGVFTVPGSGRRQGRHGDRHHVQLQRAGDHQCALTPTQLTHRSRRRHLG